jgi:vacuolar-type H+-ATPase subunit H
MDSYTDRIERLREENGSGDDNRIADAMDDALELLDELVDELESTWQMLDELKASEVSNHKEAQMETIDKVLLRTKSKLMTKVGKA